MKATESDWNNPKLGKYSDLGKQLKTMTLFVPGLSVAKESMVQEQEIESGPI
jgi:hypothetical protein